MGTKPSGVAGTVALNPPLLGKRVALREEGQSRPTIASCARVRVGWSCQVCKTEAKQLGWRENTYGAKTGPERVRNAA